ncbi:hypothetical protein TeGR_g1694 [Tetraparma gracilis]|uniref:Uncharacterized protein n=1 Tax=Tetraparma gracilis TaxID=2962635 RepID=A0ABQ6N026_9STRA|nr:hypothetical protein TeGR_g1694 [Tetraparma gracilis]
MRLLTAFLVLATAAAAQVASPDASNGNGGHGLSGGTVRRRLEDTLAPADGACSNHIQDNDETGVDCGGVSCNACPDDGSNQDHSYSYSYDDNEDDNDEHHCSSGLQDEDETGIDCGGASCDACVVAHCADYIQNEDETGTDCGGADCG